MAGELAIRDARMVLRNFEGKEKEYNPKGRRNFGVLLDAITAKEMREDGWNVKFFRVEEEGDAPQAWLPVEVSFANYPPSIVLIKFKRKKYIREEDVKILDWTDFNVVNLIISPYHWEVNGKTGIKAYLKKFYGEAAEDEFEAMYQDLPSDDEQPPWNTD